MKHRNFAFTFAFTFIFTFIFIFFLHLAAIAAEVVVYSPASVQPLHVQSTNPIASDAARSFPAAYTGHRAVCRLPGASTNDAFAAWAGGDTFTPGDPFGVSTGRDYPAIELTRTSPIMPRIDILNGTADRMLTKEDIYTELEDRVRARHLSPQALSNQLEKLDWREKNAIVKTTVRPNEEVRVRVVRWLIDGNPLWDCIVQPRTVLDKTVKVGTQGYLTEADILSDGAFDLDWQYLYSEIVRASGVREKELPVAEVDYLVVIGDGVTSFLGRYDTNVVVKAISPIIRRHYGTNHVQAVALPAGTQPLAHPVFRFRADCPDLTGYTACQIQVMSGAATNWTSGTIRIPPRDITGAYVYSAPNLTGLVSTNQHTWRVTVYNSKFHDDKWSDPVPVTFSSSSPVQPFNPSTFQPFNPSAAEVVTYSQKSAQALHVAGGGVSRSFPASYTGHRAVCRLPGASTNDTFAAWIGGDTFTPGDPYGVSTGRDYPAIELTRTSPIMPRIDIVNGTADRTLTKDEVYTGIVEKVKEKYRTSGPSTISNALARLDWMDKNAIIKTNVRPNEDVRVRVVRWLIDGNPLWDCGVERRVVLDKTVKVGTQGYLTEEDILSDEAFDLDWQYLYSEIAIASGVRGKNLPVAEVDYLVVIGDGVTSFTGPHDTSAVVEALAPIIRRHYGTNHVQAVALPAGTQQLAHPVFRFRADCPDLTGYTACQIQVMSGATTNWTSGTIRIPPRDITGAYVYSAPDLTGVISTNGTYTWRAIVYNSKYKDESQTSPAYSYSDLRLKWSDPIPVTFE